MNNKEIFLRVKKKVKMPVGYLYYIVEKDRMAVINRIEVKFSDEEKSVQKMEEVSKKAGFRFFIASDEDLDWLSENSEMLSKVLSKFAVENSRLKFKE